MTRICVAKILNAHGIKGFVKIRPFVDDISLLVNDQITLYKSENGQDKIVITLKNPVKGDYLAYIDGVNDRNAAEELRHVEIFMDEDDLPALDDDEIYHKDLVGLNVVNESDEKIGVVKSIQNFGAGDLVEIKPISGKSFYIPFNEDYVLDIDLDSETLKATNYQDFMD